MAFWGIEVRPGKPFTHSCEKSRGRLRISQATLGIGEATKKTVVQCNVGNRSPVLLCALLPTKSESRQLDLEFEESDDVVFSVIGPRSVYLTGYYVRQSPHSDPRSDSESYGVNIQNSHTDGSSYGSDEDKYEDSFIDDDEVKVSPPSPDSSSKEMEETTPKKDNLKGNKGCGRLKKKYQVIESDADDNTCESGDEDGFPLSVFKSKKSLEKTMSEARGKPDQATVGVEDKAKDNALHSNKVEKKVGLQDVNGRPERKSKLQSDDKVNQVKNENNEFVEEEKSLEDITINNKKIETDCKVHENMAETTIINQNLHTSNGSNLIQPPDLEKPKKKRKERSKNDKTVEDEIGKDQNVLKEDKHYEVEASPNIRKSKKKRKGLQLEGYSSEEIVAKCHSTLKEDKPGQGLLDADSTLKDLPAANGEYQERQIENNISTKSELLDNDCQTTRKTKKKTSKKTQGKKDSKMGEPNTTVSHENAFTEHKDQTTKTTPVCKKTLSNGLIIEVLANGPPDGKVAERGKKVKIYYTGILKETGLVFDSNVGKPACKFRLGGEGFLDGWNAGIDGMHVGEKRRLTIPPSMGYANREYGENVPPNSWLVFDIELVSVRR